MSPRSKYIVVGVVIGLIAMLLLPRWVGALIIVAVLAAPLAAYLLLDPSQRRRLRRAARKQIGS